MADCDCDDSRSSSRFFRNTLVVSSSSSSSSDTSSLSSSDTSSSLWLAEWVRTELHATLLPAAREGLRATTTRRRSGSGGVRRASTDDVYTGWAGISYLLLKVSETLKGEEEEEDPVHCLETAREFLEPSLEHLRHRSASVKKDKVAFLTGEAGCLALGAVVYERLGRAEESRWCAATLQSEAWLQGCRSEAEQPPLSSELLYGRSGFLYALLFCRQALRDSSLISADFISEVESSIFQAATLHHDACPLMYEWHQKRYLGAAHGLAGIYHTLMLVEKMRLRPPWPKETHEQLRQSVEFLASVRCPSGNYPSSLGNARDELVQWCHGAVGFVYLFGMAYELWKEPKYLERALQCGEVVWRRGLLKKGVGICHGICGNAFAFLRLYRLTGDKLHLQRAQQFAQFAMEHRRSLERARMPDSPLSLFEGYAGALFFYASLTDADAAYFPAFELPPPPPQQQPPQPTTC